MKRIMIHLACCAAALFFVGCEHEVGADLPGPEGKPLRFSAMIASSGSPVNIKTKAVDAFQADLEKVDQELIEARTRIEKKKFDYEKEDGSGDLILIYNVKSTSDTLNFASGNERTYIYECKKYIGDAQYGGEGTAEEDTHLSGNATTYSEYEFQPYGGRGFYMNNLVNDGLGKFSFYGMWRGSFAQDVAETSIPTDQSTAEEFRRADVMLAFMSMDTKVVGSETMRFVFHHSLCMLDVRVTLPLYDPGVRDEDEQKEPSGYRLRDVEMYMTNVPKDFIISTTASYNAGDPVEIAKTNMSENEIQIPMYKYYVEDSTLTYQDLDREEVGHLEEDDETGTTSHYRTYGFCGIIPPVSWMDQDENPPLLRLRLKDPISGLPEYYVFKPGTNQDEASQFYVKGGQISVLKFKLSRSLKRMMLVSAKIEPWMKLEGNLDLQEEVDMN